MKYAKVYSAAAAAALFLAPPIGRADATLGTLVYNFTYSSTQNITARDSTNNAEVYGTQMSGPNGGGANTGNIPGGPGSAITQPTTNGISHYRGALNDKGTMTVNVLQKQSDGGLVVSISEQGENVRRAPAATCVVYGNTNVICDPNKTVYTEEYTLLRFLGANFVDPSQLDANKHWSYSQNKPDETIKADYTINSNNAGNMQIGEVRTIKEIGAGHLETDVQTKIGYDFSRTLPTSVDEYATQYTDTGIGGSQRTNFQTTLQLVSDTMAKT